MLKQITFGAALALGIGGAAVAQDAAVTETETDETTAAEPAAEPTAQAQSDAPAQSEALAQSEAPAEAGTEGTAEAVEEAEGSTVTEVEAEEQTAQETAETADEVHAGEATSDDHAADGDDHAAAGDGHGEEESGDHGAGHVEDVAFSYEGPFGAFDRDQLQRGLQVYTEVCASCHGMRYVPIRTLSDEHGPGLPEDQVRAYAQTLEIWDPELGDNGDFRTATANDHFPRSAMASAPDLSLMAKGRAGFHGPYGTGLAQLFRGMGGGEYISAILTGYTGETKEEAGVTLYENTAFPGGWISMPQPLYGDDVTYADGHSADLQHVSEDVSAFLMWTAEPKLMQRKQAGFVGVLMLSVLAVLLYLTNKRIWAPLKHRKRATSPE